MQWNNLMRNRCHTFIGIGYLLILIGILVELWASKFYKTAKSTEGVISRTSTECYVQEGKNANRVYVKYWVDGKEFESLLNFYSRFFQKGDKITVFYRGEEPCKIKAKNHILFFGFIAIGIILIGTGVTGVLYLNRKDRKTQFLKKHGTRLEAIITDVPLEFHIGSLQGKYPYVIMCRYVNPVNQKVYSFKSDYLLYNYETSLYGNPITVYVDPENYKNYYVEFESIYCMLI